ncbi:hypothetical protein AG1IA_09623 [Rhizoctonia solani AG-1 IA]|uniref:Uncharacterized protein n=1 Tax=Thanatephorus cucumeris (strain AG1-IA) TaxID=983506 RepID=L8WDV4_THACA|nr:hypothetical protein AG1IA_09623 [Rhizoctonia solani AG-1 IA]
MINRKMFPFIRAALFNPAAAQSWFGPPSESAL